MKKVAGVIGVTLLLSVFFFSDFNPLLLWKPYSNWINDLFSSHLRLVMGFILGAVSIGVPLLIWSGAINSKGE